MGQRWGPVVAGLATGAVLFIAPDALAAPLVIAGALIAGWVLPSAPMLAAILFLVPSLVLGAIRLSIDEMAPYAGGLALALVTAIMFTGIFTHVGAGLALRRAQTDT